jgi:hypothetical protein
MALSISNKLTAESQSVFFRGGEGKKIVKRRIWNRKTFEKLRSGIFRDCKHFKICSMYLSRLVETTFKMLTKAVVNFVLKLFSNILI